MGENNSPVIPEWMAREVAAYDLMLTFTPASILDIGANIGAFSLMARQRWPHAAITAIEPMPDSCDAFDRNLGGSVSVNRAALRSFNGEDEIFVGDRPVTCGFHDLGRQTKKKIKVPCIDAASLDSAEFVKIDTEGCEVEILGRLNLNLTRVLCVEYHAVEDVESLTFIAGLNDLELHAHKASGKNWGTLIFARAGAIRPVPKSKVFIALPVYGGVDVHFMQSLIKMINDAPCDMMMRMNPGDSLVSRSRNTLTADFLESDATHLLFIDSDLIFSGEQIARIMAHTEDIVGGFYPKKQEGPVNWVCNGCLQETAVREDGLQEVRYMGTGFLRVSRRVFERMIEIYGETLKFKPDHHERTEHDFWSVGTYQYPDGSRRYLSEDWYFCQRALDAGFTVWGDTRIVLKHVGTAIYPLRSQETEIFSGVTPGKGTPEADVIRPPSAPEFSQLEPVPA